MCDINQLSEGLRPVVASNALGGMVEASMRDELRACFKIFTPLSTFEKDYLRRVCPINFSFVPSSDQPTHDHAYLCFAREACRAILLQESGLIESLNDRTSKDPPVKTLLFGSSSFEVNKWLSCPNVTIHLQTCESKDVIRTSVNLAGIVSRELENMTVTEQKTKSIVQREVAAVFRGTRAGTDLIKRIRHHLGEKTCEFSVDSLPSSVATVVALDSAYNLDFEAIDRIFMTTQCAQFLSLGIVPIEFIDPHVPSNPFYKIKYAYYKGRSEKPYAVADTYKSLVRAVRLKQRSKSNDGKFFPIIDDEIFISFTYQNKYGAFNNGYTHKLKNFRKWIDNLTFEVSNRKYVVQIENWINPMAVVRVTRASNQIEVRSLQFPEYYRYARVLNISKLRKLSANGKFMKEIEGTDIRQIDEVWYSIRLDEIMHIINWLFKNKADAIIDLDSVVRMVTSNMQAMKFTSGHRSEAWHLENYMVREVCRVLLTWFAIERKELREFRLQAKTVTPPKKFWQRIFSAICGPAVVLYEMLTFKFLRTHSEELTWDDAKTFLLQIPDDYDLFQMERANKATQVIPAIEVYHQPKGPCEECSDCDNLEQVFDELNTLYPDSKRQKAHCVLGQEMVEVTVPADLFKCMSNKLDEAISALPNGGLKTANQIAKDALGAMKNDLTVMFKATYLEGPAGTGKTVVVQSWIKKMRAKGDIVHVIVPFGALKTQYKNEGFEVETLQKACGWTAKCDVLIVEEFTSVAAEYLAVIISVKCPRRVIFVGDVQQCWIHGCEEGTPLSEYIEFSSLKKHRLIVCYRCPKDIVALVNSAYSNDIEAASDVERSVEWVEWGTQPQDDETPLVLTHRMQDKHADFQIECGSDEKGSRILPATARACQGMTFKNVILYVESNNALDVASRLLVALTRHTNQLKICCYDQGVRDHFHNIIPFDKVDECMSNLRIVEATKPRRPISVKTSALKEMIGSSKEHQFDPQTCCPHLKRLRKHVLPTGDLSILNMKKERTEKIARRMEQEKLDPLAFQSVRLIYKFFSEVYKLPDISDDIYSLIVSLDIVQFKRWDLLRRLLKKFSTRRSNRLIQHMKHICEDHAQKIKHAYVIISAHTYRQALRNGLRIDPYLAVLERDGFFTTESEGELLPSSVHWIITRDFDERSSLEVERWKKFVLPCVSTIFHILRSWPTKSEIINVNSTSNAVIDKLSDRFEKKVPVELNVFSRVWQFVIKTQKRHWASWIDNTMQMLWTCVCTSRQMVFANGRSKLIIPVASAFLLSPCGMRMINQLTKSFVKAPLRSLACVNAVNFLTANLIRYGKSKYERSVSQEIWLSTATRFDCSALRTKHDFCRDMFGLHKACSKNRNLRFLNSIGNNKYLTATLFSLSFDVTKTVGKVIYSKMRDAMKRRSSAQFESHALSDLSSSDSEDDSDDSNPYNNWVRDIDEDELAIMMGRIREQTVSDMNNPLLVQRFDIVYNLLFTEARPVEQKVLRHRLERIPQTHVDGINCLYVSVGELFGLGWQWLKDRTYEELRLNWVIWRQALQFSGTYDEFVAINYHRDQLPAMLNVISVVLRVDIALFTPQHNEFFMCAGDNIDHELAFLSLNNDHFVSYRRARGGGLCTISYKDYTKDATKVNFEGDNADDMVEHSKIWIDGEDTPGFTMMSEPDFDKFADTFKNTLWDAFKMTPALIGEHYFDLADDITSLNHYGVTMCTDEWRTGAYKERFFDMLSSKGNPVKFFDIFYSASFGQAYQFSGVNAMHEIACMNKRYCNVKEQYPYDEEANKLVKHVVDKWFRDCVNESLIGISVESFNHVWYKWLHDMHERQYDKRHGDVWNDPFVGLVQFRAKRFTKPTCGKAIDETKPPQGVSAWHHSLFVMFCGAMRVLGEMIRNSERSDDYMHVLTDNGMTDVEFIEKVEEVYGSLPFTCTNTITDGTMFDSQQNRFTMELEKEYYRRLGVSESFLDAYYHFRHHYTIVGTWAYAQGEYEKTSGEPATKENNGIVSKLMSHYITEGQGPAMIIYKGDDFLKRQSVQSINVDAKNQLEHYCPLRLKTAENATMEFCGYVAGAQIAAPSLYRRLIKIVSHRFRDLKHFQEYQQSLRDFVRTISIIGIERVIAVNAQVYETTHAHAYDVLEAITSFSHINENQFNSMFKKRVEFHAKPIGERNNDIVSFDKHDIVLDLDQEECNAHTWDKERVEF